MSRPPAEDPVAVFAYGSLAIPAVMEAVTGRVFAFGDALLEGFARTRLQRRSYPGIAPAPQSSTPGRLYAGVDGATLALLDRFEGDLYCRCSVRVRTPTGEQPEAQVYVVAPEQRHLLTAEPWSQERFRAQVLPAYLEACRRFHRRARAGEPGAG